MTNRWKRVEEMLFLSITFTVFLLAFRMLYWGQLSFIFYLWNLTLAVVPISISRRLYQLKGFNFKAVIMLSAWLLFLPNAPYIITDIFHFSERPPVPKWFDLLLVTSAAWNGLMLGIVSIMQVEDFLKKHLPAIKVTVIISVVILMCAFGIYLGRFLRFNSWDVLTDTGDLLRQIKHPLVSPQHNVGTWAFTILFGAMLWLVYFTIKQMKDREEYG